MEGFDVVTKPLRPESGRKTLHKTRDTKTDELQLRQLEDQIQSLENDLKQLRNKQEELTPIHPNMSALKYQYSGIRNAGDLQVELLLESISHESKRHQELDQSINKYESKLKDCENDKMIRDAFVNRMVETLRISLFEEREFRSEKEADVVEMVSKLKRLNEENTAMCRQSEKERIVNPQKKEGDINLVCHLKGQLADNEKVVRGLELELEELGKTVKSNHEAKRLMQNNLELESKALKLDKDIAGFKMKVGELGMVLKGHFQQREAELMQKKRLVGLIEEVRAKID